MCIGGVGSVVGINAPGHLMLSIWHYCYGGPLTVSIGPAQLPFKLNELLEKPGSCYFYLWQDLRLPVLGKAFFFSISIFNRYEDSKESLGKEEDHYRSSLPLPPFHKR